MIKLSRRQAVMGASIAAIAPAAGAQAAVPASGQQALGYYRCRYPFPAVGHVEKNGSGYREVLVNWSAFV